MNGKVMGLLPFFYEWQFDKACVLGRMINPLRRLLVIGRSGPKNIGHECLRIAVVKREPTGLDLNHDAVPRQEDMIRVGKGESIFQRFI